MPEMSPTGMEGIFVSSDTVSRKRMYYLELYILVNLFRQAGEEEIMSISNVRDNNGDWKVTGALAGPLGVED